MGVTGSWDEVFAGAAPDVAATARALRAILRDRHPGAVETARPRERSVTFGFGARKMIEGYAYLMPHRAHLNLGFLRGTDLPDPSGLLDGSGKALRHVKLRGPEEAGRPGILALIDAARSERARALGLAQKDSA